MTFVGADLGGTKLAVAAFTDDGELISREAIPLAGRHGAAVGALIAALVRREDIAGFGILWIVAAKGAIVARIGADQVTHYPNQPWARSLVLEASVLDVARHERAIEREPTDGAGDIAMATHDLAI